LQELLQDATAGDPITGMKWTHRSLRKLCKALRRRGVRLSPTTLARLMRRRRFSLRTCRKQKAGIRNCNRARQFRYLLRLRNWYFARKWPVISVDTKKKEWVGNFKNPGRSWRRRPHQVFDHDYPSWAEGRANPAGIYDPAYNDGYVVIGITKETPTFEVEAIRRWWLDVGRQRYGNKCPLLIEVDGGGANDHRKWEWKCALQRFADACGLTITVTHYPPGASKWNPIDHRMFSLISANWAGEPLRSYETMLKHIRTTRSDTGFHCRARLDERAYETQKISAEQKASIRLKRRQVLPEWNYTIRPHKGRPIS